MTKVVLEVVLSLAAGFGLGLFYFGGLYLTLQRLTAARRPHLLVTGSYWLRLGITLLGFYWVADGHWERFLYCTAGWWIARTVLVSRMGPGLRECNERVPR